MKELTDDKMIKLFESRKGEFFFLLVFLVGKLLSDEMEDKKKGESSKKIRTLWAYNGNKEREKEKSCCCSSSNFLFFSYSVFLPSTLSLIFSRRRTFTTATTVLREGMLNKKSILVWCSMVNGILSSCANGVMEWHARKKLKMMMNKKE